MHTRHDELRDELVAILGAARELPADTDSQLADAFVRYMEGEPGRSAGRQTPADLPHRAHYTIWLSGALWGAAVLLLYIQLVRFNPPPQRFAFHALVVLAAVFVITRALFYVGRVDWRLPAIHIIVARSSEGPRGRS